MHRYSLRMEARKRHVFIIHDEQLANDQLAVGTMQCISLTHPKHNRPCRYLLIGDTILEIQRVIQEPCSWFIGQSTEPDGALHVATRFDVLYMAIPMLFRSRNQTKDHAGYFCSRSQLFGDCELPQSIIPCHTQLSLICDTRDSSTNDNSDCKANGDTAVYRLNDDRVIQWCRAKVDRIAECVQSDASLCPIGMERKDAHDKLQSAVPNVSILRVALGLISEYLPSSIFDMLSTSYGMSRRPNAVIAARLDTVTSTTTTTIPTVSTSSMRMSSDAVSGETITSSRWDGPPLLTHNADTRRDPFDITDSKKRKEVPKETTSAKKLAKVSTSGMKALASYFGSPAKKK